jgi:predicted RNA-binding Zn ribbon-like protein
VGGNPAIDFVNTLAANGNGPLELLDSADSVAQWSLLSGLFTKEQSLRLREALVGQAAVAELESIRSLRRVIHEILARVGAGEDFADRAATQLNPILERMPLFIRASADEGRLGVKFATAEGTRPVDEFMSRVAHEALNLLAAADPRHIRKCANPACVLYFHDTTKNHRRLWCSMAACGNRAKASRFRRRKHA